MIEYSLIESYIASGNVTELASYMKKHNLKLDGNKIVADNNYLDLAYDFWDKRQLVRKILLNSA